MPGGGPEPVRAWFYPGDLIGQEFIYPKHRMTEILAAMNKGRITVAQNTQTTTNTETAAVAPPPVMEQQQTEQQTEEKVEETPTPAPTPSPAPVEEPAPVAAPTPEQPAPAPEMPHTSSNTIEIGALGLMCLGLAISFRIANRIGSGS
jgi:outer membrane biosynthesis protein TonB